MKPLLIIFAGKAGTGKTTMAVSVSRKPVLPIWITIRSYSRFFRA
jgi:hypothetical protein